MFFLWSVLSNTCIFYMYLLTESCDSLLSWPCANLGRLSHQKIFFKNTFCLLDITVDTLFRDCILPLVSSIRSPDDSMQCLKNTYELENICFIICYIIYFWNNKYQLLTFIYYHICCLFRYQSSVTHDQPMSWPRDLYNNAIYQHINAHRLWACRGMPFDDVCQISLTRTLECGSS